MINKPLYCLTSDIDWASEYCISDLLELSERFGITPTLFATHDSAAIKAFGAENPDEVGVHPNFLAGSSHGADYQSVIDHVFGLVPSAKTFRSHSFADSSHIIEEMVARGVRYDSNLCLYLQPNIVPLRLGIGPMTRLPVFWEDDIHWMQTGGDWDLEHFIGAFTSPGIKIINVHPFLLTANVPSDEYYRQVKGHIKTLSADTVGAVRYDGAGTRTFLIELLEHLRSRGERFFTLGELHEMLPVESFLVREDESDGRETRHTEEEHGQYWRMSDADKQKFLQASFNQRNADDKYATSRDYNARELEIQAIAGGLADQAPVVDLGCGNGYTLISLAKRLDNWDLTGVDFSENLIEGARHLVDREKDQLRTTPSFVCGDAIAYLKDLADGAVGYVITERFIQNLPTKQWQEDILREIHRVLSDGGRLIMCEGSLDGFRSLNDIREKVGLSRVPQTSADNVSAIRIEEESFEAYAQSEVGFTLVRKCGFSCYYLISRVLHPIVVSPLSPRYDSKLNDVARRIQENMDFAPGYGSNVLWILEK